MVPHDSNQLPRRARRVYELGRLRFAARLAFVVVPVALAAVALGAPWPEAFCLTGILSGAGIWLRWRGRDVGSSVLPGVLAGAVPLLASGAVALTDGSCQALASPCVGFSILAGLAAGLLVGWTARQAREGRLLRWLACATIAISTSCLSCLGLGLGPSLGSAAGILGASLPFVILGAGRPGRA
ncbi:hypothetical protein [Hyalangium rubrum]|uniref:Uncharacterized protein n=1 Tax=Hyalangium rubrum TaxID=3103134 RepID=A0ABU5H0J4_9BACT|nr:hypothetical protein [Hyalangium sp. s54d21]MDY7226967.1 hypothetical protein [Hyalangium sp. s54d21]